MEKTQQELHDEIIEMIRNVNDKLGKTVKNDMVFIASVELNDMVVGEIRNLTNYLSIEKRIQGFWLQFDADRDDELLPIKIN